MRTIHDSRQRLEVTLTHPPAAFAARSALEGMSEDPVYADGALVALSVPEQRGAIMEAARRLIRAGVAAEHIALRAPVCVAAEHIALRAPAGVSAYQRFGLAR